MTPKWKRAGPSGEIEITIKGQKYQIQKALDHNERHKGEWKIMVWDKRRQEWEWDNTVRNKAYAKELVMDKLEEHTKRKAHSTATHVTEAATPMRTLKLIDKIKKSGVVKSGSMKKEEMTTTASIPNPATTAMGPRFKAHNVTDRRRRKDKTPVVLKRFRKYMDDK